ncbi:hypothetical protein BGZ61DRAFT_65069 [Ilyonectria robusta]|uniref:uncharacterized protein n=1 Tax=Ilyonectria robusta TaxID=1079257 RepID=UPI001E8D502B|nr:uncharacterized protein BGZ61DRAFT_65069 [Ilyonectria robusta]KAH8646435.1 hypothetical protein BGZ61DRAFT_65069 [Ilyonectria robusta]
MASRWVEKAKSKARRLLQPAPQDSASAPSPATSSPTPSRPPSELATRPTSQPTPSPPTSTDSKTSPLPSLQERLWNQAYDELKASEPKVVEAYEKILSAELCRNDSTSVASRPTENEIGRIRETRCRQMQQLVQEGLDRTQKAASIKRGIDEGLQAVQAVRGIVDKAVQAAPEAAVAWAGVCLVLEILSNPVTEARDNRKGIAYVLSRMEWYWNLVSLLLDENKAEQSSAGLRVQLEKHVVQLYEKLLSYQMQSICLYHRNRAAVIGRDMLKIDDWAGQLSEIQEAEGAVQRDMEQYNTEESRTQFRKLTDAATALEMNLQDIHSAIQDQTRQQERRHLDDRDKQCLKDLRETDPRDDKTRICSICKDSSSLRCSRCKGQWYCSEKCQRADWPTHRKSCGVVVVIDGVHIFPGFKARFGNRLESSSPSLAGSSIQITCYPKSAWSFSALLPRDKTLVRGMVAWLCHRARGQVLTSMNIVTHTDIARDLAIDVLNTTPWPSTMIMGLNGSSMHSKDEVDVSTVLIQMSEALLAAGRKTEDPEVKRDHYSSALYSLSGWETHITPQSKIAWNDQGYSALTELFMLSKVQGRTEEAYSYALLVVRTATNGAKGDLPMLWECATVFRDSQNHGLAMIVAMKLKNTLFDQQATDLLKEVRPRTNDILTWMASEACRSWNKNVDRRDKIASLPRCTQCEDQATCLICQENLCGESVRLKCSHLFHPPCIQAWLADESTCPTCRAVVLEA